MVDSFFLHIDWTTVAMVVGLLASLIAVFFTDNDATAFKLNPRTPVTVREREDW